MHTCVCTLVLLPDCNPRSEIRNPKHTDPSGLKSEIRKYIWDIPRSATASTRYRWPVWTRVCPNSYGIFPGQQKLQPGTGGLYEPESVLTPMGYSQVSNSFSHVQVGWSNTYGIFPGQQQLQPGTGGQQGPESDLAPTEYYQVNNSFNPLHVTWMLQPSTGDLNGP